MNLKRSVKDKTGLGLNEYTAVPPPPAQVYSPPKNDMSWSGLPEFVDDTVIDYSRPTPSMDVPRDSRKPNVKYAEMYRSQRPRGNQGTGIIRSSTARKWTLWMHRLRGGMSMIKNLMQKLLLLVQKLMILLLKLKCTSEGVQQRQKIKKTEDFQSRRVYMVSTVLHMEYYVTTVRLDGMWASYAKRWKVSTVRLMLKLFEVFYASIDIREEVLTVCIMRYRVFTITWSVTHVRHADLSRDRGLEIKDKKELAIPGQTATGKELSNPLMAGSLPKTINNMVAYLEKSDENVEFHQIMDFLSTCSINYALTAVEISESSVRNDLLFDDEDGIT
ncbi:hypothetical protein Tco_0812818 [Tanacetum coccineum]